jgi:hypothetical protein
MVNMVNVRTFLSSNHPKKSAGPSPRSRCRWRSAHIPSRWCSRIAERCRWRQGNMLENVRQLMIFMMTIMGTTMFHECFNVSIVMAVPQKTLDGLFHGFMENPPRMMVTSHHIPMFPMPCYPLHGDCAGTRIIRSHWCLIWSSPDLCEFQDLPS